MQTKIHEPTQIVEVMLTHAEQADEAVKKQSPPCCRAGSAGTQGGRSVSTVRQRRFRFLLCQIFCRLQ